METEVTDPQFIVDVIDNEGWPDALGWLVNKNFGNEELNQLVYDATQQAGILAGFERQIKNACEDLGVDWYIG